MRISDWSSDVCSSDLEVHGVVRRVRPDDHAGVAVHRVPAAAVEAAVALTPRIANEKKALRRLFFSGDARWATVGAHLGAMGIAGKAIAPECAPTKRWVRARLFEKLAAEAAVRKGFG